MVPTQSAQTIQSPTSTLPVQVKSSSSVKSSLLVIMAICLLIATCLAGLFYFQIQKLSKELSQYQIQPSPTPTATPDPTADWKTYTNTVYRYSLKHPQNWKTEALAAGSQGKEALENSTGLNIIEADSVKDYPDTTIQVFDLEPTYLEEGTKTTMVVNGIEMIKRETKQETNLYTQVYTMKVLNGKFLEILFRYNPTAQTLGVFDQILSTFKFLE